MNMKRKKNTVHCGKRSTSKEPILHVTKKKKRKQNLKLHQHLIHKPPKEKSIQRELS